MKKTIAMLVLLLTLVFCAGSVYAAELPEDGGNPTEDTETEETVYSVKIVFQKNGGKGTMASVDVSSDKTTNKLPKNKFTRTGFTFNGWNTKANGKGTSYANKADMTSLATLANDGKTINLYAQWKVNAPTSIKVKKLTPASVKISYKKNSKASGYDIQYGTKSNFKKAKKITVSKKTTSKEIVELTPGKTYYFRVRSYYKSGSKKYYGDWSKPKKTTLKKGNTISNTKSKASIEADITLKGSGTGYHAKLVICTATSAVSYGIQYDQCAVAPYTGKAMAMIENVAHNGAGGQQYTRPGNKELKCGNTYHMMMTIDNKGKGAVYLDYKKIGNFTNSGLANQYLYLRVEGSARLNGDKINATFQNIKCKTNGKYNPDKVWGLHEFKTNPTLKGKRKKDGTIVISGYISGLPAGGDWDNQYGSVSEIVQFVE